MKYAVELGSGAVMHLPSFVKIGSGILKLLRGDSQRDRLYGDRISLLSFHPNKGSYLKTNNS
jgi:hypothetical protein